MPLTLAEIQNAKDDAALFQKLSAALGEIFPPELQDDRDRFYAALLVAPQGLRAKAGIYDLDVSMTMDDLAWHFGNHNDDRFLAETIASLKELGADEAANLFIAAWEIVEPFLAEIREKDRDPGDFTDYLQNSGIQSKIDPLNEDMWAICKACGDLGLMQYWLTYARKYPEKCVKGN